MASSFAVIVLSVALASLVAWAGGDGAAELIGVSVMGWCAALAFVIQWMAFIPAYRLQSERFYDLTGSLTYIGVTVLAVATTLPMVLVLTEAGRTRVESSFVRS